MTSWSLSFIPKIDAWGEWDFVERLYMNKKWAHESFIPARTDDHHASRCQVVEEYLLAKNFLHSGVMSS
jgi:hypothetical protein